MKPGSVIPATLDGGQWAACFGVSWSEMLLYDAAGPARMIREGGMYLRKQAGTMGVAAARNEIAAAFLASDAEWLFMVDSDMGFRPDTVERLVASATEYRAQVMGGLCFAQKVDRRAGGAESPLHAVRYRIQPTIYSYRELKSGERGFQSISNYRRGEVQTTAATGAACLLIHRDLLNKIGPEPFHPFTDPNGAGPGTPRTFSEDLSFCVRAAATGAPIYVDTSVRTTHYKGGIFLDEETFLAQEAQRSASPLGVPVEDLAARPVDARSSVGALL